MSVSIYWFRNDLRLTDNPALAEACSGTDELVLVYVRSTEETRQTRWGFPRWSELRREFRDQALQGLEDEVSQRGRCLNILEGSVVEQILSLAGQTGAQCIHCETIAAPEEVAEVAALRAAGLEVRDRWQSSLLDPADLPFGIEQLPDVFTAFRHAVERAGVLPRPAIGVAMTLPASTPPASIPAVAASAGSAWRAFSDPRFCGDETSALAQLERYFASAAPQSYKLTRNELFGIEYSTKFSPWLAVGALSPRSVFEALKAHEARLGANESTYWIWFELLWRDFFRLWSQKHGALLFRARGLGQQPPSGHAPDAFERWCAGKTGHPFVDAGMRELTATGFLSNRMRQVVASYLIHELCCDWRAGAAWFESRLIDYDVCSNQGNWLYLAGRGADPRQGRWFNPDKQAAQYDPEGAYRALWPARHSAQF